jgi:TolB-like protein/Tfp pilus assembly protein PilF
MGEANNGAPESSQILLRIGINLGDVIGEGDDVFGEGVNIAARLEPLAAPGGICISGKVHEEVRGKANVTFEDLGEQGLKNISVPVRAFSWKAGGAGAPYIAAASGRPSIAVLPFANLSGDPEQQYFSDGITEDIITELARFNQLHVVARNASFRHRGTDLDLMRVGRELAADYLLEGSVRKLGPRIRITAQLIEAKTAHHLWAEKFDRDQEEIFAVQDEVVRTIVATLFGRVQAAGLEGLLRKPPASLSAYECVLRADALPFDDSDAWREARRLYDRAIALDPGYARAYALSAINYNLVWEREGHDTPHPLLDAALDHALKAVALDANDSVCHNALGVIYLNRRAHHLSEHHFQRAVQLNPNRATLMASYGWHCAYAGRPQEGIERFKEARRLDSFYQTSWYWSGLAGAQFIARQYAEAIATFERSAKLGLWSRCYLAASHAHAGNREQARRGAAEILRQNPDFSAGRFAAREPFKLDEDRQHLAQGLREAGLPD